MLRRSIHPYGEDKPNRSGWAAQIPDAALKTLHESGIYARVFGMKGPREYKAIIARLRRREARRFGVRNGGLPVMDFPRLDRLLYNSKRLHRRAGVKPNSIAGGRG